MSAHAHAHAHGGEDSNWDALLQSFVMIVVSEIGDKTFLIAAIMATRHPRITVFGGAFASLVIMSILSAALGRVILGLIPKVWTLWAAGALFLLFGLKMLQESLSMSSSHLSEEMREVEEELEHDSSVHDSQNPKGMAIPLEDVEEGRGGGAESLGLAPGEKDASRPTSPNPSSSRAPSTPRARASSPKPANGPARNGGNKMALSHPLSGVSAGGKGKGAGRSSAEDVKDGVRRALQVLVNPVFAQAFILTFLGEWGDRSQITTIAMGGAHSIPVIAFGTILGHGLCTLGAVMGGRWLSTKISVKHISLIGSAAFLIFAVLYGIEAWQTPLDARPGDDMSWR